MIQNNIFNHQIFDKSINPFPVTGRLFFIGRTFKLKQAFIARMLPMWKKGIQQVIITNTYLDVTNTNSLMKEFIRGIYQTRGEYWRF